MQVVFWIGENIGDLNGFALQQDSRDHTAASRRERLGLHKLIVLSRVTVARRVVIRPDILLAHDRGLIRLTQSCRRLDQCVEHGLEVEGGAADHLEHVGGGGLLLKRFAQLIEQAGVLDGDDGLARKIGDQLDLIIGDGPHFLAVDDNRADELVLLEHRDGEKSPATSEFGDGNEWAIALDVSLLRRNVGNVYYLLFPRHAAKGRFWVRMNNWLAPSLFGVGERHAVQRDSSEYLSFAERQSAELGSADVHRAFQHGPKHGLQLTRRRTNDAENIGGGRLLLQCLA